MPWRTTCLMDERLQFIREYESGLFSMTELCDQFQISRKTGYRVLDVYEREGLDGLRPRSRRPHTSPRKTPDRIVKALVACRLQHPHWGPKKLLRYTQRHEPRLCQPDEWPGASTVARMLADHELTVRRSASRRVWKRPRDDGRASTAPNVVWTADYKGEFRTADGRWCYPLTVMDGFSRYLLGCQGFLGPTADDTRRAFQRLFHRYGLPEQIRTDNGTPFAGPGVAGLSPLSVWWMRLGIVVLRIERGHPEQNGAHERMHRTMKAETTRPPATSLRQQQARFTVFRREYNQERPHEALDFDVPAAHYTASSRQFPSRLCAVQYPGHMEVRSVYPHGDIRVWGRRLFLSEALRGERVGLEEVDDGIWDICFGPTRLARLNRRTWALHPRPTEVRGGS